MERLKNWHLFAICVVVWSTTWHAIIYQIADMTPATGIALRFGLASAVVFAMCVLRGTPLQFSFSQHVLLALQGALMFGLAYVCVYHAERYIASGLVAVGYSASPLVTGLGARLLFATPLTTRFVAGGTLGVGGVALMFWPEFGAAADDPAIALGALFTTGGVVFSAAGNLVASRNHLRGLPFWPALGYGMLYGAVTSAFIASLQGGRFLPPAEPAWWLSLLYLALAGSVLTFACFLTLQRRIGPGPTSTIGVMTPLLALLVSVALENFRPGALTYAGAVFALAGNVMMLRCPRQAGGAPPVAPRQGPVS